MSGLDSLARFVLKSLGNTESIRKYKSEPCCACRNVFSIIITMTTQYIFSPQKILSRFIWARRPGQRAPDKRPYLRGVSFLPAGVMQFTADTPFEAAPSSFNAVPATSI